MTSILSRLARLLPAAASMPAPESEARPTVVLQQVCFDFQLRGERFLHHLRTFLEQNLSQLDLDGDEDPVAAYLERVWPDNLPGTFIVANITMGEYPRWLIRPPVDGPLAASFAAGHRAPAFQAYRRQAHLVVDRFEIAPHVRPRPFEQVASGPVRINSTDTYMPPEDFAILEDLPRHRQHTEERLTLWREYLDWKKKLVHLGQTALPYDHVELTDHGQARFFLQGQHDARRLRYRLGNTWLQAASRAASQSPDCWQPLPGGHPRLIGIGEVRRVEPTGSEGTSVIVTVATRDDEPPAIPEAGFILSSIGGELRPLSNERRAIDRLRNSQGYNLYLGDCLFAIRNAAEPETIPDVGAQPLAQLNEDQRTAINKALAAPDMFLLQGPPGTGKTTVIAVICYLLCRLGKRVLVTSQTNLAVDNVLERLASRPEVRPLRVGRPERVEPEFQVFLEDKVVGVWFQAVRRDAEQRYRQRQAEDQRARTALEALSALKQVLHQAEEARTQRARVEQQLGKLHRQREDLLTVRSTADSHTQALKRRRQALSELASWSQDSAASPPSGELLKDTPLTEVLGTGLAELRAAVADQRWELPWLTQAGKTPNSCLLAIDQARRAASTAADLEPSLKEALELCRNSVVSGESAESRQLRKLQAEKAVLVNSDREEDALRLVQLNRRIADLKGDRWAGVCRSLQQDLLILFDSRIPPELEELISALQPAQTSAALLNELLDFVGQVRDRLHPVLSRTFASIHEQALTHISEVEGKVECQREQTARVLDQLSEMEVRIEEANDQLRDLRARLQELESRWAERWPAACPDLGEPTAPPTLEQGAWGQREVALNAWHRDRSAGQARQTRWQPILAEWIHRIGDSIEADRQQVRALYTRRANVVGLTCNEAGQRHYYDQPDFEPFDVVIVDEVSKATPPELIMPMLLGRKVILVGDHRQLPPMFRERESTYAEAVAEDTLKAEDFQRFEKMVTGSFFQELFEAAPESLRHSLLTQYRMHPQIMAAVNQFYDGWLVAGGGDEVMDGRRQHHLTIKDLRGGRLLEPHQHLLWVDSTLDQRGQDAPEQQRGTSKANPLEAELIVAMLLRLGEALARRGYGPPQEAVATAAEKGIKVQEWLARLLEGATAETVADLLARGQVKLGGRRVRGDEVVHRGDQLELDARKPVGVITFYGAQLRAIRQHLQQGKGSHAPALSALNLRTNTVDRFQGMEQAIILVSLVRAGQGRYVGDYVKQYQRLNVAFSRAQELLVIVGSERIFRKAMIELPELTGATTQTVPAYRNIFRLVTQYGGRRYAKQLLR